MNRIQFFVVLFLSLVVAGLVLLQMGLLRLSNSEDAREQQVSTTLQTGEISFDHLKRLAERLVQVEQEKKDPDIAALLDRNNIKIGPPPAGHQTTPVSGDPTGAGAPVAPAVPEVAPSATSTH